MSAIVQLGVGVIAVALGTWFGAWWAPALWGALAGAAWAAARPARWAALAAAIAWGLLLARSAVLGEPVAALATGLATSLLLPAWALFVATPLFAAVLAGTAARLAALVKSARARGES